MRGAGGNVRMYLCVWNSAAVRSLTSALLAEVARAYPVGWYAHSATGYCEWAAAVLSGLLRAELVDLVVGRRAEQRDDQLDLVVRCNRRALRAESFRHPNHRTVPRCTVVPPCSAWHSNAACGRCAEGGWGARMVCVWGRCVGNHDTAEWGPWLRTISAWEEGFPVQHFSVDTPTGLHSHSDTRGGC